MAKADGNIYETDKLLNEYLLFHYGTDSEILPWSFGPSAALNFASRCVTECIDVSAIPPGARALDVGCAVGRSSFELAVHCSEVLGVDLSSRFIEAANTLAAGGSIPYVRMDEGDSTTQLVAKAPALPRKGSLRFEVRDACAELEALGEFDIVLAANLIDRVLSPADFLGALRQLVKPGGTLVLTSPYTWLEAFTPRAAWLSAKAGGTAASIAAALGDGFELTRQRDVPFLIREHARKYQWSVAEATVWRRK